MYYITLNFNSRNGLIRRVLGSLPEIRHKTAVSTIRSTTDKSIRERPRQKVEEARKRPTQRKDATRGKFSIELCCWIGLITDPCGASGISISVQFQGRLRLLAVEPIKIERVKRHLVWARIKRV